MTRRKDPLSIVKQLADITELEKSQQVALSIATLSAEEQRLAVLERYLAEYRGGEISEAALAIDLLRSRHDFIAALDAAVRTQSEQVEQLRAQFERKLTSWRDAKAKVGAVDRFAGRREAERERVRARAEQAQLDDTGRWSRR